MLAPPARKLMLPAICAMVLFSGCGPQSSSSGATAGSDSALIAAAQSAVASGYRGIFHQPNTNDPKPNSGVYVWVISCGEISPGCSEASKGVAQATQAIGWKMTLFDGKLDPANWNAGIMQAIAAKADGIITESIDCPQIQRSLQAAHNAGIKIYAFYGFDCNEPSAGGQPLFDGSTDYGGKYGRDYGQFLLGYGRLIADYAIMKTNGKADVLDFAVKGYLFAKYISEGIHEELALCHGCKIAQTIDYVGGDLGPGLVAKAQTALLQHPDANVVTTEFDYAAEVLAPVFRQAQQSRSLLSIGGEGLPANFDLIRDKRGEDALFAGSPAWMGWAAIAGINRLLHGQQVADCGQGYQIVDGTHNLPPAGTPYAPPIDFRTAYLKGWGVTG